MNPWYQISYKDISRLNIPAYKIKILINFKDCYNSKIKDTVGPMTDDFGNAILDDGVNVKLLNEYFASIFTKENLVDITMYNKASCKNALNTVDFTEETVYDKLCKLRADKSAGVDRIFQLC